LKSFRKELWFNTKKRREFINITRLLEQCVRESGIQEGLLLCNAMHITASVFINDGQLPLPSLMLRTGRGLRKQDS